MNHKIESVTIILSYHKIKHAQTQHLKRETNVSVIVKPVHHLNTQAKKHNTNINYHIIIIIILQYYINTRRSPIDISGLYMTGPEY